MRFFSIQNAKPPPPFENFPSQYDRVVFVTVKNSEIYDSLGSGSSK